MVERITRINRYRLLLLVLCTLVVIASFVYAQLLLGPFWESINDSKVGQPQVLSENRNRSITYYDSVMDVNNVISSPACLPFQFQNRIRNGTHIKNDFYNHFWSEKQFTRPTRIHLLHMRKAGGTSLKAYFKKVVNSNSTSFRQFDSCEGDKECLELDDTNGDGYHSYYNKIDHKKRRKDASGRTLYVTSLREPIGRAISNYKYEMRFYCVLGNVEDPNITEKGTLDDFATQKHMYANHNRHNVLPFGVPGNKLWVCNSNCYARWVTGMYIPKNIDQWSLSKFNTHYPVIADYYYDNTNNGTNKKSNQMEMSEYGRALSNKALRLLLQYDVIIVLEWLKSDPEYARFLEDVFFGGVRGIGTPRDAYCAKAMRYKNNLLPLTIENSTLQKLQLANNIDTQLYQTLTACRYI